MIFGFLLVSLNMFSQTKNTYIYHDAEDNRANIDYRSVNDSCAVLYIETKPSLNSISIKGGYLIKSIWGLADRPGVSRNNCHQLKNSISANNSSDKLINKTIMFTSQKGINSELGPQFVLHTFYIPFGTRSIELSAPDFEPLTCIFPDGINPGKSYNLRLFPHFRLPFDTSKESASIIFSCDYLDTDLNFKIELKDYEYYLRKDMEEKINPGKYTLSVSPWWSFPWEYKIEIAAGDKIELSNKFSTVKIPFFKKFMTRILFIDTLDIEIETVVVKRNGQVVHEADLKQK